MATRMALAPVYGRELSTAKEALAPPLVALLHPVRLFSNPGLVIRFCASSRPALARKIAVMALLARELVMFFVREASMVLVWKQCLCSRSFRQLSAGCARFGICVAHGGAGLDAHGRGLSHGIELGPGAKVAALDLPGGWGGMAVFWPGRFRAGQMPRSPRMRMRFGTLVRRRLNCWIDLSWRMDMASSTLSVTVRRSRS